MTTAAIEETVGRFAGRPGYRLITYREVGLPFWDVPLRCRLLAKKTLPVLDEFILKSVDAGLRRSDEVAEFLTLPGVVTDTIMGALVSTSHLLPAKSSEYPDEIHFSLSDRGRKILREHAEITPREETLRLTFDGLTAEYKTVDNSLRWRPRDLREYDILEIPAFPADPPSVGPSDTSAVRAALQQVLNDSSRELLRVLGVDGKREKFFVRAIALVFASSDRPDETSVHFVIDGRPSEQHDLAFARAEGQRKLGIVGSLRDTDAAIEAAIGPQLVAQRADDPELAAMRRLTEGYRNQLASLEHKASSATDDQKAELVDQAAQLAEKLDEAEAALENMPVRVLDVHEHAPLLADALANARSSLLIVSPWIRAAVVSQDFLSRLRNLLENGVAVAIGYGIGEDGAAQEKDQEAERTLRNLSNEFDNFLFTRLGDTHAKVLIVDDRYAVVTSFNWLSFRGDPNRPFRDERGTLITLEPEVRRLRADYLGRISAPENTRQGHSTTPVNGR